MLPHKDANVAGDQTYFRSRSVTAPNGAMCFKKAGRSVLTWQSL